MIVGMLGREEWLDEQECAEAILAELERVRADRQEWVLAVQTPTSKGLATKLYGPYPTRRKADVAQRKGVGQVSDADRVAVFPMTSPLAAEQAQQA